MVQVRLIGAPVRLRARNTGYGKGLLRELALVGLGGDRDDAEELCREGRYLLTMPAPPEVAAYRRWSLGESERQIAGHPPCPWPEEAERLGLTVDASGRQGGPARSGGGA